MGSLEKNARGALRRARWLLAVGCLVSLVPVVAGLSHDPDVESINMTAGGVAWVTTLDVDELEQPDEKVTLVEQEQAGEEFSSLESILHWAIGM